MMFESPMLAIRRAPADHHTQACCLGPTFCKIEIGHFYHGWYIVAIRDPGVVFDLRTWHRCDREQSYWLFINSGSQGKKFNREIYLNLSFNLVKVRYPAIIFFTYQANKVNCLRNFPCQLNSNVFLILKLVLNVLVIFFYLRFLKIFRRNTGLNVYQLRKSLDNIEGNKVNLNNSSVSSR